MALCMYKESFGMKENYHIYALQYCLFIIFNIHLGFPCLKCWKNVTPFGASENEDRGFRLP